MKITKLHYIPNQALPTLLAKASKFTVAYRIIINLSF